MTQGFTSSPSNFQVKAYVIYDAANQVIRDSFNVSSVTYNATGDYTINFTTAMGSTYYGCLCTAQVTGSGSLNSVLGIESDGNRLTTSVRVLHKRSDASYQDVTYNCVMIF